MVSRSQNPSRVLRPRRGAEGVFLGAVLGSLTGVALTPRRGAEADVALHARATHDSIAHTSEMNGNAVPLMEALELAAPEYNLEFVSGRRLGRDGALLLVRTTQGYRKLEATIPLTGDREVDDDALYARFIEVMAETA